MPISRGERCRSSGSPWEEQKLQIHRKVSTAILTLLGIATALRKNTPLLKQSPEGFITSVFSIATVTPLGIASFLREKGAAPQAVPRSTENYDFCNCVSVKTSASLLRQSPGGAQMSKFSTATVTPLGIANFLGETAPLLRQSPGEAKMSNKHAVLRAMCARGVHMQMQTFLRNNIQAFGNHRHCSRCLRRAVRIVVKVLSLFASPRSRFGMPLQINWIHHQRAA